MKTYLPLLATVACASAQSAQTPPARETNGETCVLQLTVERIGVDGDTCWIDERVSAAPGVFIFPCAGGTATATFGEARFTGRVEQGNAELNLTTQFDFQDNCRWKSHQRLFGPLDLGQLTYEYSEAPVENQNGCAVGCSARGVVHLRQELAFGREFSP